MSVATPAFESRAEMAAGAAPGRVRQAEVAEKERNYAVAMHLAPLVLTVLGFWPLSVVPSIVMWLVRRDRSGFDDDHGREITNFLISFHLWHLVTGVTLVGLILWPVIWIVGVVSAIRGAIAASRGDYFRYPITLRLIR